MEIPVHIQKSRGDEAFIAFCPDLPGCSAIGSTSDVAVALLRRRIVEYFAKDAARPVLPGTRRTSIAL